MQKQFKKVLVANRGEIAIRIFRACAELGIKSVGIYSKEDKYSLFRTKADESYLIGEDKGPIDAYLDMDGIIELAKEKNVDAIHPGYGFLAENPEFIRKCEENGIVFIGPSADIMDRMGDKINSKKVIQIIGKNSANNALKKLVLKTLIIINGVIIIVIMLLYGFGIKNMHNNPIGTVMTM
mgnify:CR=1 FL=1